MNFKFYPEPFDTNKPPPTPPNRDMKSCFFFGTPMVETKKSKQRSAEYNYRLDELGLNRIKKQTKDLEALQESRNWNLSQG